MNYPIKFRIGLDARSVADKMCGISRVTLGTIKSLSKIDQYNEYVIYVDTYKADLDKNLGHNFEIRPTNCNRMNFFRDRKFKLMMESDKLDLYHSFHSFLPFFITNTAKIFVTIHDLFALNDPRFFAKYGPLDKVAQMYFRRLIERSVERADIIITVSEYCKKEIISNFPNSRDKIYVIYNASDLAANRSREIKLEKLAGKRYLLYVGNSRSYKNTEVLIDGYHRYLIRKNSCEDVELVIAGNDSYRAIEHKAKRLGIDNNVIIFNNPTDDELRSLYSNSLAFIMPSRWEGFGLPVVEGMSFGIPVITSDADALVEIARGASLVFKKDSPEELATAIETLVDNKALRNMLVVKGFERAKDFTWERSAQRLQELYNSVLSKESNK